MEFSSPYQHKKKKIKGLFFFLNELNLRDFYDFSKGKETLNKIKQNEPRKKEQEKQQK